LAQSRAGHGSAPGGAQGNSRSRVALAKGAGGAKGTPRPRALSSVWTSSSSQAMAANPEASASPCGCQPRAPGGEASITRASTVAKVPITRISSALAVSGGTRSSIVSCRSWPAARSVAYHRVPSAMWMTAWATVQSISGIGLVQSRSSAAPSSAWHSPAASSTSPPSTVPFSPTPRPAAGLTAAGRRIVGSCPVREEVVVSPPGGGVGAHRWELALVAVTAVWGSTFVLVRDAVAQVPPFTFIAYRFLAAALLLAVVQLATIGLLAPAWAGGRRRPGRPQHRRGLGRPGHHLGGRLGGAFLIQTRAQREVSPTRTAVVLTMEPVFAGVFGFLLAGERLTGQGWLGAGLILAGMPVAELGGRLPAAPGRPVTDGGQP
jgi:hypothetical protein